MTPSISLRILTGLVWGIMAYFSLAVAALSVQYLLSLDYDPFFHDHYMRILPLVFIHGIPGAVVLALGPTQFWPLIRARWPHVHNSVGYIYVWGLGISGSAALIMGTIALGGGVVRAGSCVLALLWLFTAFIGVRHARAHRLAEHRRWMMRNFALTLSVITCRLYLMIFQDLGWTIQEIAPWIAWLAWLPNLAVAEIMARYLPSRAPDEPRVISSQVTTGS